MRKKLGSLFVTICIVLIAIYIFRYKLEVVLDGKIPKSATEIIHVDLRQIEHHFLADAIKNPSKYINFKTKKKEKESLRKTVSIPKNLLFFTNTSTYKSAWFSNFVNVKNGDKLQRYLLQEGFKEVTSDNLKLFNKDRITIGILNGKIVIAIKKQREDSVVQVFENLFQETSFYEKNDYLLQSIANSQSDITYSSAKADFLEANFENGLLEIKGTLISELFLDDIYVDNSENSVGFMAAKVNKKHTLFKSLSSHKNGKKFNDFTKLSLDSIIDKWDGRVVIDLNSVDKTIDTIVTYEYDDDFNKIEKKSIQELRTPDVNFILGSKGSLYTYFMENNAIRSIDNDTLFTSIPLYKMFVKKQHDELYIFTKNQLDVRANKEAKIKFRAFLDMEKYIKNPLEFSQVSAKDNYLKFIKDTSVELTSDDEFFLQIHLKEDSRNFLPQLAIP